MKVAPKRIAALSASSIALVGLSATAAGAAVTAPAMTDAAAKTQAASPGSLTSVVTGQPDVAFGTAQPAARRARSLTTAGPCTNGVWLRSRERDRSQASPAIKRKRKCAERGSAPVINYPSAALPVHQFRDISHLVVFAGRRTLASDRRALPGESTRDRSCSRVGMLIIVWSATP